MDLRLQAERVRVHLPAALAFASAAHAPLHATCTKLSSLDAKLEADVVPTLGDRLELLLTLPRRNSLKLFGTVTWAITTSAPALLCGKVDCELGGEFVLEFAPTSPDLFALSSMLHQSGQRRRARIQRMARRIGLPTSRMA